jgi:Zn-dependent protease with chaperone function
LTLASDGVEIASGKWHASGSSLAHAARLVVSGEMVRIMLEDDVVTLQSRVADMTVSDRIGRIPRRLTFEDGSLFETANNDAIDMLLRAHGADRRGWIAELERFHPRLIAFAAAVFLFAWLIYRYAIPVLVEIAVLVTPPVVPQMMSSGTLSSLDQAVFSPSTLPAVEQNEIRAKFEAIASHTTRGAANYKLNFRKGGYIGPNAFALPDGTLVITDELIRLAGKDQEMILGVLAHEIGHVEKDHSLRQLYRAAGTAGLIMLVAGDVGSAGEEILTDGAALLSLSYSRSAEAEADRISAELMAKAGHDPAAIGRFFALLEKTLGDRAETSMLSTHPGTPERRQAIEDYAKLLREKKNGDQ